MSTAKNIDAKVGKQNTRDKLIHAATTLFTQSGYSGTTLDEIAKKAKIRKSLIIYHFDDKKGLFECCVRGVIDLFQSIIEENSQLKDSALEELHKNFEANLILDEKQAGAIQLMTSFYALSPEDEDLTQLFREVFSSVRKKYAKLLVRSIRENDVQSGLPIEIAASLIHNFIVGAAISFNAYPSRKEALLSLRKQWQWLVKGMLINA